MTMRTPCSTRKSKCCLLLSIVLATAAASQAEARTWVVAAAHAQADDAGPGTEERPFRTIAPAALAAQPGDTILVHPGVYRQRVVPAHGGEKDRPIVYLSAQRGQAVIKGSDVFSPKWERVEGPEPIFRGVLDPAVFQGENPFHRGVSINGSDTSKQVRPAQGELEEVLGEVFVESQPYTQVVRLADLRKQERSWLVSEDGKSIRVHFPAATEPSRCLVEITTRNRIFAPLRRGLGHIHIKGFTFEHSANQGPFPQGGAVSVRSGHDWVIEGNTIRFAATIGLDCGSETWDGKALTDTVPEEQRVMIGGRHLIRDNDVTDNGLCGIAGWNHSGTRIVGNRVERNNRRKFPHGRGGWEEWAGIKLHAANALIQGNVVRDNHAFGIWIDNGYGDARIDGNLVLRNRLAGIFLELGNHPGHPCRVTNNVVGGTTGEGFYGGFGIYTHDASDVVVAHNLIFDNAGFGVLMRTITDRQASGKRVETSRNQILNNLFVNNAGGLMSLPYPNGRSQGLTSNNNVFWSDTPGPQAPFAINCYQDDIKPRDVAEELRRRLKQASTADQQLPEADAWAKNPRLTLDNWRLSLERDQGSQQHRMAVRCDDRSLPASLTLTLDAAIAKMPCTRVEGLSADFREKALPPSRPLPGPFQGLQSGENKIGLEPGADKSP